jgi:hypothetical protein
MRKSTAYFMAVGNVKNKLRIEYILTSAVLLVYGAIEFTLTPNKISAFIPLLMAVIAVILVGRAFVYIADVSRKFIVGSSTILTRVCPKRKGTS